MLEGIEQARAQGHRLALVELLRVRGMVLARRRRWNEAEQAFEEAVSVARSIRYPYAEARSLRVGADVCRQAGSEAGWGPVGGGGRDLSGAGITTVLRSGSEGDGRAGAGLNRLRSCVHGASQGVGPLTCLLADVRIATATQSILGSNALHYNGSDSIWEP